MSPRRLGRAARRRLLTLAGRVIGHRRIAAATQTIWAAGPAEPTAGSDAPVLIVSSHRVTTDDRLAILSATVAHVASSLPSAAPPVRILDASPERMRGRVGAVWEASGLDVDLRASTEPLAAAIEGALTDLSGHYVCLQLDDILTVGMSERYLAGAAALLGRHDGNVGAVCPIWPLDVRLDTARQRVGIVPYEQRRGRDGTVRYRFWHARPRRPVSIEVHEGLRFGIFENFGYGLVVNDLVAPADDYRRRLRWYLDKVGTGSAHDVELAALPKLAGPWWTHIGICLDGVSLLDLDFAHTEAAVRDERPGNRAIFDAVKAGWELVCEPCSVGF